LHREWAYRGLPRKIIVEPVLLDAQGNIPADYKAYVIGGKVRFIQVDRGRFGQHTRNLYSREWEPLKARLTLNNHAFDDRPAKLDELVKVAEQLAEPFEFLRVDFFVSDDWPALSALFPQVSISNLASIGRSKVLRHTIYGLASVAKMTLFSASLAPRNSIGVELTASSDLLSLGVPLMSGG
jgi:TupA-like ATPgrasp